jgi:DivIVA domain-containing protein
MLLPQDIEAVQFRATRLKEGYDQEEVDEFLDRVARDYREALTDLQKTRDKLSAVERQNLAAANAQTAVLATPAPPAPSAEGILRMAQETADRHVAEAQAKADDIVREAGAKGAQAIEDADRAADEIKFAARKSANEIIAAAQAEANEITSRKEQISEQIRALAERRAAYKQWLKETFEHMDREDSRG